MINGYIHFFEKGGKWQDDIYEQNKLDYLIALENPDKIGYDPKTDRWVRPPENKGYDTNQVGYGIDLTQNPGANELYNKQGYLTHDQMMEYVYKNIRDKEGAMGRALPVNTFTPEMKLMALGMLYRGDSVNENIARNIVHGKSYQDLEKAIVNFYNRKKLSTRAKAHSDFFNNYRKSIKPSKPSKQLINPVYTPPFGLTPIYGIDLFNNKYERH